MTKQYLGVWLDDEANRHVMSTADPIDVLRLGRGQVSPLFPAVPGNPEFSLPNRGVLLFLVPKSPSSLLARLINDFGDEIREGAYITHGHAAAVVLFEEREGCDATVNALRDELRGFEIWPFESGIISPEGVFVEEPKPKTDWLAPEPIDASALIYEARAQVEQFNSNLSIFSRVASTYAPEMEDLVVAVRDNVAGVVERLAELKDSPEGTREALSLEVHLVDMNAVLTIYTSQMGSGSVPLGADFFPVGEYSLLGIGAMCRGAWRIYSHLNKTFSSHDHPGTIKRAYPAMEPFNPYAPTARIDYSAWNKVSARVEDLDVEPEDEARQHIPYFSSRWGFHESLNAISLSWQCLYAAASKEWNLLTITHEYLHSHVRDIFGVIFDPESGDPVAEVVASYNAHEIGANAQASMRIAYVEALASIETIMNLASAVHGVDQNLDGNFPDQINELYLRDIYKRHTELLHEIVVHVLDFWYVYDGKDDVYVNSIWSSWSLVPSVANRVAHYVLRTLASLASTSPQNETPDKFNDASERLLASLKKISDRDRSRPVIDEAIRLLEDPVELRRLGLQFSAVRYIVELTLHFFKDSRLNAALVRDDEIAVLDGERTYNVNFGTYPGLSIGSPVSFLLDQFPHYEDQAGSERVEHESIWQMLQLI